MGWGALWSVTFLRECLGVLIERGFAVAYVDRLIYIAIDYIGRY